MKSNISLKWFITLAFLSLGIALVAGYSLLSAHYFLRGMDSIMASNMEQAVKSFAASVPPEQRKQLTRFSGYDISPHWEQMPAEVQNAFLTAPTRAGNLLKHDDSGWLRPPETILFVMHCNHSGEIFYVSRRVTRATSSALIGRNAAQSLKILLIISILTASLLTLTIHLLIKGVSRPVKALGKWAKALDEKNLNQPPPDFSYPELNALANLIRSSLSSVQQSLEREHRFLRHTSHELRTPITVIRNNIELMKKLKKATDSVQEPREVNVIDRIDRASLTMKHLTETLLWLGRDIPGPLATAPLILDQLLLELVKENQYLLKGKNVDVETNTAPYKAQLPAAATRIVLGNLLRNAFQHTWQGRVRIQQLKNSVEIINECHDATDAPQDLGFGLGLQLTAQLTEKLAWPYTNEKGPLGHRVTVTLGGSDVSP